MPDGRRPTLRGARRELRPNRTAWAWDWRSAARSSKPMGAGCGRNRIRGQARRFPSVSPRPQRPWCERKAESRKRIFVVSHLRAVLPCGWSQPSSENAFPLCEGRAGRGGRGDRARCSAPRFLTFPGKEGTNPGLYGWTRHDLRIESGPLYERFVLRPARSSRRMLPDCRKHRAGCRTTSLSRLASRRSATASATSRTFGNFRSYVRASDASVARITPFHHRSARRTTVGVQATCANRRTRVCAGGSLFVSVGPAECRPQPAGVLRPGRSAAAARGCWPRRTPWVFGRSARYRRSA